MSAFYPKNVRAAIGGLATFQSDDMFVIWVAIDLLAVDTFVQGEGTKRPLLGDAKHLSEKSEKFLNKTAHTS